MRIFLVAAILCGLALPAFAQNAVVQEGTAKQYAPMMFSGDHRVRQGATVEGAPTGRIVTTGDAVVGGRCDYSSPTDASGGYQRLCMDAATGTIKFDGTKSPAQPTLKLEVNGTTYDLPGSAALVGSDIAVANLAGAKTAQGSIGKRIARLGYANPGDGGLASYNWSATNCTAADDGAQIQPTSVTGCWIADFGSLRPMPEIWGAKGDGIVDDAAAVNAALLYASVNGGKLYARAGSKYGVRSTISLRPDTCFIGAGMDKSQIKLLDGTVTPVIDMQSRSCLEEFQIDASPQNVGGRIVVQMGTSLSSIRSIMRRVTINYGCIGVDINGVSHSIDQSFVYNMAAVTGCGGIRVGHNTTGANTVEARITNTTTQCDFTAVDAADYNMLVEDSGGVFIGPGVDNIGCRNGLIIRPGSSQEVDYTFCSGSAIGDTNLYEGVLIDTTNSTAKVNGNSFSQCWTSGSKGRSGVKIQNTGGGSISGTIFTGHRSYLNFFNGIEITTPVSGTITGTQFEAIRVCGTQAGTDLLIGNNLDAVVQNSRFGKNCDGIVAGNTVGLLYGIGIGTNVTLIVSGNDISYTGGETWTPIAGFPIGDSIVVNNRPVDTASGPTYASASTITLNQVASRLHLTGTTTVNTISPVWNGQKLCIISDDGVINFGTTGNIKAAIATAGAGQMLCGHYDSVLTKWYFH
jgi:hypothetical protein